MNFTEYAKGYIEYFDDLNDIRKVDTPIYHYCSLENALKILDNEKIKANEIELFASHIAFLNDSEELRNGKKIFTEVIKNWIKDFKIKHNEDEEFKLFEHTVENFLSTINDNEYDVLFKNYNEIYVTCFSKANNSLTQWKYYGKNSGISIELDFDNCKYDAKIGEDAWIPIQPYMVVYCDDKKTSFMNKQIKNIFDEFTLDRDDINKERGLKRNLEYLYSVCCLFKHDDFKDENECRLLFRPLFDRDEKEIRRQIKYRFSNNIIIPYMKIRIKKENILKREETIIKSITVGPGKNQNLIFDGLTHFLLNRDLGDNKYAYAYKEQGKHDRKIGNILIRKSHTPFRG